MSSFSSTVADPRPLRRSDAPTRRRRHDIDGLRAVAVLLVVAYHVWFGRVSGGVDVFLMVSAYFLTSSFVNAMEDARRTSLVGFWAKRFASLLPAAAVTLVGVLALAWVAYPASHWNTIWNQTWASLLYFQNWELAQSAVDYYDRGVPLSPLQHFWSLSVQGQVFVLWPVLLVLAGWVVRRTSLRPRDVVTVVFGAVFALSLAYALLSTSVSPQFAYFDTFGRLWEFALGSLLAVWGSRIVLPGWMGALLGWIGLVGLVTCGVVIDAQAGAAVSLAWWAIVAAACVMVGGAGAPTGGPTRFLTIGPVRFLGRIAYPLYLVHWPILVTWMLVQGRNDVGPLGGLAVVALSVVLAAGVAYGIERPVLRTFVASSRERVRGAVAVVSIVAVVIPLATWQISERLSVGGDWDYSTHPGARALSDGDAGVDEHPIRPAGSELESEWVTLPMSCEGEFAPLDALVADNCMQTPLGMVPQPLVLIIGDSHAQQWMGALTPIAEREGWQLVSVLRGGCHLGLDQPGLGDSAACEEWRVAVLEYAARLSPDAVMTVGTSARVDSADETVPAGLSTALESLNESGAAVLTLRDNPRFEQSPFRCAERWGADSSRCRFPASEKLAPRDPGARLDNLPGVDHVDLTDLLCPEGVCLPVIGNVAVYRDDNHLTRSYAESMSGILEERLRATAWWRSLA